MIESELLRHAAGVTTLGVHSLYGFALGVPDLEAGRAFYSNFGLMATPSGNTIALSTGEARIGTLYESPRRELHHLSFGIDADDLPQFAARAQHAGAELVDPPAGVNARPGIWVRDPDGHLVELAVGPRTAPTSKSFMRVSISDAGVPGAPEFGRPVQPRRLGHVLLFTPDVNRMLDFYTRVLGLRLSDRSGDIIVFMHGPHGSDHHMIAVARGDRPGFHHASFEVGGVDEIGMGAENMLQHGHRAGWGFGRHYVGSNYFHYVRDPWGSFAEYFCDIDYIPAGSTWNIRDVKPEYSLHIWGPQVPPYFLINYEGLSASEVALPANA